MKKIFLSLLVMLILVTPIFTSCSNQEVKVENKEFDYSKLLLKAEVLNDVLLKIENYKNRSNQFRTANSEKEMITILEPLIENGEIIHNTMIREIIVTDEFQNLTEFEQQEILNLTDEQLVELSFIVNFQYQTESVDWDRARSCASFALGITGIRNLYLNTAALGTVETMIGALKLIGKRYLGYVAVALMIYDFADCVYGD